MLVVLPYIHKDRDQMARLCQWLLELGGVENHDCLLVAGRDKYGACPHDQDIRDLCAKAFNRVLGRIEAQYVESTGTWGDGTTDASGPNEAFLTAKDWILHRWKKPWGWMESDAAPIRSTWLDEWESEYLKGAKPFMGMLVNVPPHEPHMSGIGVYPGDIAKYSVDMALPGRIAWDYAGRRDTVGKKRAHFTNLIQHVYRLNGQEPEWPTFPTLESLSQINPEAAVFHRCKDLSLLDRLTERLRGQKPAPKELPSREATLETRVKELEKELEWMKLKFHASLVEDAEDRANKTGPFEVLKNGRTAGEQAAINERMAKARAARKPKAKRRKRKLTGVL